jgi:hypothetical protein
MTTTAPPTVQTEDQPPAPAPAAAAPPPPLRTSALLRVLRAILAIALSLFMGAAALWLFTRNNDFPVWYHPDETSKAQQLLDPSQDRNFNHPLLLLESAEFANRMYDVAHNVRDIVFAGRWVSAGLAALGVVALALAAYHWGGFPALLIGGLVMAMCPPVLVYAHYFKEDTALVGGIMLAMLGARLTVGAKHWWTQLLACIVLGVGCGAATSGKYVGVAAAVPCVLAVFIAPLFGSWRRWVWIIAVRWAVFVSITVVTVLAINWRMFENGFSWPPQFTPEASDKIVTEFGHATQAHSQMALPKPNYFCLSVATAETMWHLWAIMAVGAVGWLIELVRFRGVGSVSRWGVVLGGFLLTFVVALSFDVIPFNRYALPITICFYFIAATFAAKLVSDAWRWNRWAGGGALVACLALIVGLQGGRCLNFDRQFLDDGRDRLREWIATNLPPGVMVVADNYTALATPGDPYRRPHQKPLRQQILRSSMYASDSAGTVEQLADQGIDYVAVASMTYERFFVPQIGGAPGSEALYARRRKFYDDLFARGELLWSSVPSPPTHSFTNQEVRVYRITKLAHDPSRRGRQRGSGWLKGLFGG